MSAPPAGADRTGRPPATSHTDEAPARCLTVGLTSSELSSLRGTPATHLGVGPDRAAVLDDPEVRAHLAAGPDVVVVGSTVPRPVQAVQRIHRAAPDAQPIVLAAPATADRVRRDFSYAPGVPLELAVHPSYDDSEGLASDSLQDLVTERLEAAAESRRHRAVLAAVAARTPAAAHAHPAPGVDLGPLLQHAPVGVVVCEPDGRLRGWNARAAALLDLDDPGSAPAPDLTLVDALPGAEPVLQAAAGDLGDDEFHLTTAGGRVVEVTAVPSEGEQGHNVVLVLLVDVTERHRAERERERLAGHVDLLTAVSRSLERTLDVHEALGRLTEVLVPDFADWVSVQLADDTERPGALSLVAVRHRDPAMADVVDAARARQSRFASDRAPSRRAARGGEPVLLTDLDEATVAEYVDDPELRELFMRLGLSSVVAVPLPGRDGVLGSMVLVNGPDSPTWTAPDVTVAMEIGRRAGVALDNARLYSQQRDLATELQQSLLTDPPQPDHAEIVVRYVPAAHEAQVGGDWYDAFIQPDGATVLVVGDVAGHDRRAAAAMSQVRGVLRGIGYTTGEDPARLLTRADQALEGLMIPAVATAVVIRLEQTEEDHALGRTWISWSSAGHPPPMVMHPDGHVEALRPEGGVAGRPTLDDAGLVPVPDMLLGLDPDRTRTCWRTCVPRGTTLFLYTDGLVERRGEVLDDGLHRLRRVLADLGPRTTLDDLCDLVVEQMVPGEQEDDVALVAVRLHRQDGPRPTVAGPEDLPAPLA